MVGIGYDIHRLAPERKLIIGGVHIDFHLGAVAHSDGDVLLHSICDALLGAAGMGDIGEHFPDDDKKYEEISSLLLLNEVVNNLQNRKFQIINIDATIILEKPKIFAYKKQMIENISQICQIPVESVNIKATTNEGVGFIGTGEAIAALCICELQLDDGK